ncbi:hypothetical protein SE15_09825 [Thermanaerothrix daxensis]|uniref:Uncharacterized protein n=2 Tax=Thermanaerothrix daxensis TaxID=869279 RepID=A0A0P6YJ87_9CHLR|nr:hypothetical protein [Thermanaerothrix daxensis]KPL82444.1 hypothetical protein SE15_09825 [Thermanaerothrix daxensis]
MNTNSESFEEVPTTPTEGVPGATAGGEIPEPVAEKPQRRWWQKALTWLLIVLLAFGAGFGVAFFALYFPLQREAASMRSELNTLRQDYEKASAELETLRADYQRAEEALTSGQLDMVLSRLISNVSYARLALITKDNLTAQQELSAAEARLKDLEPLLNDPQTFQALQERFKVIRNSLTSNPNKALEELRLLSENLARIRMR